MVALRHPFQCVFRSMSLDVGCQNTKHRYIFFIHISHLYRENKGIPSTVFTVWNDLGIPCAAGCHDFFFCSMWQLRTCDVNTVDCIPEVAMVFSAFIRKALFSTWNSQWLVSSTTILVSRTYIHSPFPSKSK